MSLFSRIVARQWRLPPAIQRNIKTEELRIPMRDGSKLLARRYYSARAAAQPTVLVRSCYGIGGPFGLIGSLFAERGFQVILQNCRGVGGSEGIFRPFFDEQNDGEDTVNWLTRASVVRRESGVVGRELFGEHGLGDCEFAGGGEGQGDGAARHAHELP